MMHASLRLRAMSRLQKLYPNITRMHAALTKANTFKLFAVVFTSSNGDMDMIKTAHRYPHSNHIANAMSFEIGIVVSNASTMSCVFWAFSTCHDCVAQLDHRVYLLSDGVATTSSQLTFRRH